MITKGIIRKIPSGLKKNVDGEVKIDNKYLVEIPIFNSAGVEKNSLTSSLMEASLCYTPGNLNGYRENDVVFVGFEDNNLARPIILGKLYLGEEECTNYAKANALEVNGVAKLPLDTQIGEITGENLELFVRDIANIKSKLEEIINN